MTVPFPVSLSRGRVKYHPNHVEMIIMNKTTERVY